MDDRADEILSEAGVDDNDIISHQERKNILSSIQNSKESSLASSSSIDAGTEGGSGLESRDEEKNVKENFSNNEFDSYHERSKPGKPPNFKNGNGAGPGAGSQASKAAQGKQSKNPPNTVSAGRGRNIKPDSNCHTNTGPNVDVWLVKRTTGKTVPSKKASSSKSEGEEGNLETESSAGKDNVNTSPDESKEEKSPVVEVIPLAPLVFKHRGTTSLFSEKVFPPLSIPREEWVSQVCQCLFARKAAKIRDEARQSSKWVILSERNISVSSLENTMAKASKADEASFNGSENIGSPKTRAPLENNGDTGTARTDSPELLIIENSPKRETPNTEIQENAAIALPDISNKLGKVDTPQNSPAGRNDEDNGGSNFEPIKKRGGGRNRARRARGSVRSQNSTHSDDNSNEAQNSALIEKSDNTDNIPNNADFPPISPRSPPNNYETEVGCPICSQVFPKNVIEEHAWTCVGGTEEGETQMADNSENGRTTDINEKTENYFKQNKPFCNEDDDLIFTSERNLKCTSKKDNDDSYFISSYPRTRASKRSLKFSDEEDTPSKSSRK